MTIRTTRSQTDEPKRRDEVKVELRLDHHCPVIQVVIQLQAVAIMSDADDLCLPCVETGDPVNPIMFFIHGWPDTSHIWDAQLEHFSSRFRCVAVKLPGFDERTKAELTFEKLEAKLVATFQQTLANSPHQKLTLVCHDWGALFGYQLERKLNAKIDKFVTIDVGGNFRMENWRQRVGITFYQLWLIMAYFIGKVLPPVGDWLTRIMVSLLKAPKRPVAAHSEMNYLYWYFWLSLIKTGKFAAIDGEYQPTCPLLFIYGKDKPFHLHTRDWIHLLDSQPHSQTIGIDADHWVMYREPNLTNRAIDDFLSDDCPVAKPSEQD